jgi:glycosyltransferase involved in cell wall biosynthesis
MPRRGQGYRRGGGGLRVLFLASDDWYFWTHRRPLAWAVRERGAEVLVMTISGDKSVALEREGFPIIPWRVARGNLNPWGEVSAFLQVVRAYRRVRPDLVHHVGLKPVVYGGLAARHWGPIPSINAISGLGHLFTSTSLKMRLLRRLVLRLLRNALRVESARTIFENPDNLNLLVNAGVISAKSATVVRSVGVNLREFSPRPELEGPSMVVLPSRMLWEKGIGDFVKAAQRLRARGVLGRFVLVGSPDAANPTSIPETQLSAWSASGFVEWWGQRSDMPSVFAQSQVVCFPSYYGEGVPRVLIEAAASGRAIVTTDSTGCREVVRHGENGLLVPPRDPRALAEAIATLLKDPALRARMGARGREIAVQEFSEERVVQETMSVYRDLLGARWPAATLESERPGCQPRLSSWRI